MRGPRATDQFKHSAQEELEEMEELKEEADEARRLAEEWENKYKVGLNDVQADSGRLRNSC